MQEFRALSYIRKYRAAVIAASLLLGAAFYLFCTWAQAYTASAVIQYKNAGAAEGLAADGTALDTSEIYSSEVVAKAFQEMGLSFDEYNMDEIRANIVVEPLFSEEEAAMRQALSEEGEAAEEEPTRYLVSYTAKSRNVPGAEKFAARLLKAMLDAYVEAYAENHVNSAVSIISVNGVYDRDYDYIEMAELLRESAGEAETQMWKRAESKFRSSETGYSYADLARGYRLLSRIDIPNAYAYILSGRITKDQDVLLAKYRNRIETAEIGNSVSGEEADGLRGIMDTYARMIKEATNAYTTTRQLAASESGGLATEEVTEDITYQYILDEVYNNYWKDYTKSGGGEGDDSGTWNQGDQTTEYDTLISRYVGERTGLEESLVDIAYYSYIIDVYSGRVDDESGLLVENTEESVQGILTDAGSASENLEEGDAGEAPGSRREGNTEEPPGSPEEENTGTAAGEGNTGEPTDGGDAGEPMDGGDAGEPMDGGDAEEPGAAGEGAETWGVPAGAAAAESSEEEKSAAYQMVKEAADKLDRLNEAAILTNQEYNRYKGAENIAVMTDIVTAPALNVMVYSAIAFVLFVVAGCALAVIGGRLSEIFEYYVYMDRKLELPNRAACDRYIGKYAGQILPTGFACAAFRILGIEEKNRKYGRDGCDAMIGGFCGILRGLFPSKRAFAAVNALGQFVVFMEKTDKAEVDAYIRELAGRCAEYNRGNECGISYACGAAISGEDGIYNIRKLMVQAVNAASSAAENKKDGKERP